jgi:hypothetical protein
MVAGKVFLKQVAVLMRHVMKKMKVQIADQE